MLSQLSRLKCLQSINFHKSLPFSLRQRVTILKDKSRRSRGVAFIQFQKPEEAETCVKAVDSTEVRITLKYLQTNDLT